LRVELGSPAICSEVAPPEVDLKNAGRTASCHFRDGNDDIAVAAEASRSVFQPAPPTL
jgi:hypothetical protein